MQSTSLGLDPERVLFVRVPNGTSLETAEAQQQFLAQALTRIRALPGVEAASSTTGFPPFGGYPADFDVVGASQGQQRRAMVEQISDGYFTTLTMRLRRGRDFTADDVGGRRRVAVVNERLVELHLKGEADPIGRGLSLALPGGERPIGAGGLRDRRRRRRREEPGHHRRRSSPRSSSRRRWRRRATARACS